MSPKPWGIQRGPPGALQKLCTYALRVRRRDPLSTNDQTPVPPRRPAVHDPEET